MKYLLLLPILFLASCTDNQRARSFGGKQTINLPANRKLINVTWKTDDMWILTRARQANEAKETFEFQEKSSFGMLEGTITIVEQ